MNGHLLWGPPLGLHHLRGKRQKAGDEMHEINPVSCLLFPAF